MGHADPAALAEIEEQFRDLCAERALELGADAERFLEWIADRSIELADIVVGSRSTERRISAQAALIAHAPTWLREAAIEAMVSETHLQDSEVSVGGKVVDIEVALVSLAPQWLRDALVDWLSETSLIADDVEAQIAHENERAAAENARDDFEWEAA